ncbi:fatty acid desaturase [Pseudomonas abieticivorans]|uniref:fatty acid desaturase n=1 Tax=Pseudomonas abieticivorans TaxID=2931382 RepID=UPI0020BF1E54|nr:fatty acid desaturase [Pseudomonas sp. PIA16]
MPAYLDAAHQTHINQLQSSLTARTDWPTWLLLLGTYAAWFGLIHYSPRLGQGLTLLLLVPLITFWMSLQHELLHGHPTRLAWLNKALGYAPIALWYPYTLYRDSHLLHHRDAELTCPHLDPESRYFDRHAWDRSSLAGRGLHWVNKTLFGRLLVGPALALANLLAGELSRLRHGVLQAWAMWLCHAACVAALLYFVHGQGGLSVAAYLLASVLALALSMVRSYYEHRPAASPEQRSVINEAGWPWRWLFLNLNLHLIHHDLPGLPWYYLPRVYAQRREDWLRRSGQFLVRGYGALFSRHGFRPIDSPRHPWH